MCSRVFVGRFTRAGGRAGLTLRNARGRAAWCRIHQTLAGSSKYSYAGYMSQPLTTTDMAADAVLTSVSRRIAALTGIAPHDGEDWQLAVNVPFNKSKPNLHSLHLDINKRPRRMVTVLMHLAGSGEVEGGSSESEGDDGAAGGSDTAIGDDPAADEGVVVGGETIFPCLTNTSAPKPRAQGALCTTLDREYQTGIGNHQLAVLTESPYGIHFDERKARFVSELCSRMPPAQSMVRFTPRRGDALLFLSVEPSHGRPLSQMWHGGCRVRRGEKLLLTAFKALPPAPPAWAMELWAALKATSPSLALTLAGL
eukprot:6960190-Prymnesium_polylepis.1